MRLMTTSDNGVALIKKNEGFSAKAYKCPAGRWTIGYGTTKDVKAGMIISEAEAEEFLRRDIVPLERELNGLNINMRQTQFDALVSWLYNLGVGNFRKSTLRKKIVSGASDSEIVNEIKKWNKSGGKVLPGLMNRREEEAQLFVK